MKNNKLEKISKFVAIGIGTITLLSALIWTVYDSYRTRKEILEEAKNKNVNVYDVAKERGRTDVIDMQILSELKLEPLPFYLFP